MVKFGPPLLKKSWVQFSPDTEGFRHSRQTGTVFVAGPRTATRSSRISSSGEMSLDATKCRPNVSETSIRNGRHRLVAISPFLAPPRCTRRWFSPQATTPQPWGQSRPESGLRHIKHRLSDIENKKETSSQIFSFSMFFVASLTTL